MNPASKLNEFKSLVDEFNGIPPSEVALKLSHLRAEDRKFVANQIKGRKKAAKKFPFLLEFDNIVFPDGHALEQSSSEKSARFKASLFTGTSFLDLSGGFGIDSMFFVGQFQKGTLIEHNGELANLVRSNAKNMNLNLEVIHTEAEDFLKQENMHFDLIYLDPDRRSTQKRAFRLEDCEPKVLDVLPTLKEQAENILIKVSPMADIHLLLHQLPEASEVYVVSMGNECKEILLSFSRSPFTGNIHCIDLDKNSKYTFNMHEESGVAVEPTSMKSYLYLPNTSLTKAGAFRSPIRDFNLKKISNNTHLYTSDHLVSEFPGRIFKIRRVLPYKKEELKKIRGKQSYTIIKRNFSEEMDSIYKKLQLKKSGSDEYLFVYRNQENRPELSIGKQLFPNESGD